MQVDFLIDASVAQVVLRHLCVLGIFLDRDALAIGRQRPGHPDGAVAV